ncbi:MAG TPA: T9SS type A sorting domain-containing protein [Parasegetibacter sp.]
MKRNLPLSMALVILCHLFSVVCLAQTQTAKNISINKNCRGFYEYLPQGYNSGGEFPLIVFLHGQGELGNGGSELSRVLRNGIPKLANEGRFPASFNVNGVTHRFIVISPQFVEWPSPADVDAVIEYAKANYRVNNRRIYLTGLSMGGGAAWEYAGNNSNYARKLAAMIIVCGASWPESSRAAVIAAAGVPVWAFHNDGDPTVPAYYSTDYVNHYNRLKSPGLPDAKLTIFNSSSHNAWTRAYDPAYKDPSTNKNIYEWALQFGVGTESALPVILKTYEAHRTGAAVEINWSTASEINNSYFVVERSRDGRVFRAIDSVRATNAANGSEYTYIDMNPEPGYNFYKLVQVDFDGKKTYFDILKVEVSMNNNSVLNVDPNPAVSGFVTLSLNDSFTGRLQFLLTDMQGHIFKSWHSEKVQHLWSESVNLSSLSRGNYILKLKTGAYAETRKIMKL